nr:isochorismatase family protein [Microbacterium sp. NIBRBAC000506063]
MARCRQRQRRAFRRGAGLRRLLAGALRRGHRGCRVRPLLATDAITHHVRKGQGKPAYSMFEGVSDAGGTVGELLSSHGVLTADVVGIATDHCVRATALDALAHGVRVRVLTSLVAGVDEGASRAALAELAHGGADLIEG